MAGVGISGIASGVDTDSIVSQLMALERTKLTRSSLRQTSVQARQTGLRDVETKLKALKTAAADLASVATWGDRQSVTSSDPARVAASATGIVPPGGYAIEVASLAAGARQTLAWTPPAGEATLQVGDDEPVALAAGTTLDDLVRALNGRAEGSVWAANVGGSLVLTTRETGEHVANPAVTLDGAPLAPTATRPGADAAYTVDGDPFEAPGNTVMLDGVTLSFKAPTAGPVVVAAGEPGVDQEAIKTKVKAFVDAYNAVVTGTRAKLDEKAVASPTTSTEASKGQLFGDTALVGMLARLRVEVSEDVDGLDNAALNSLAELGISTGGGAGGASSADAKMGKLVIDDAKLTAALEASPQDVRALFAGKDGLGGFAKELQALVEAQVTSATSGEGAGALTQRIAGADAELTRLRDQATKISERLDAKETRLRAQFAAMEKALGLAQSQQSWLSGQIASLSAQLG